MGLLFSIRFIETDSGSELCVKGVKGEMSDLRLALLLSSLKGGLTAVDFQPNAADCYSWWNTLGSRKVATQDHTDYLSHATRTATHASLQEAYHMTMTPSPTKRSLFFFFFSHSLEVGSFKLLRHVCRGSWPVRVAQMRSCGPGQGDV